MCDTCTNDARKGVRAQPSAVKGRLVIEPAVLAGYIVTRPSYMNPVPGSQSSTSEVLYAGTLAACTSFIEQYYEPATAAEA